MSPLKQREKIKGFLLKRTNLYDDIYRDVAKERWQKASTRMGTNVTLKEYMFHNEDIITREANMVLDELCDEIVAEKPYTYLLRQIGIFSLFLAPPLYPLVRYAVKLKSDLPDSLIEFSFCIVSILLLLVIIGASAYAVFKTSFSDIN